MRSFRADVAANYAGTVFVVLLGFFVTPIVLALLGSESFGLLGVLATLSVLMGILDFGLGAAACREIASRPGASAPLVRTLEAVTWPGGMLVALLVALSASTIARSWLQLGSITPSVATEAIVLIGVAIGARWPFGFYLGVLQGLEQQVTLNALRAGAEFFRIAGGLAALWFIDRSITTYLAWYAFASVLASLVAAVIVWRRVPGAFLATRADFGLLARLRSVAAGLALVTGTGLVASQVDKVVLSHVLTLEAFGFYALSWTAASGIWHLTSPVQSVAYPRLCALAASTDEAGLRREFHRACRAIAFAVFPIAAVLAIFPFEFLFLWTQNAQYAEQAAGPLRFLALGSTAYAALAIPQTLQTAHGWMRLNAGLNIALVVVLIPSTYFLGREHGAVGGSLAWLAATLVFFATMSHLMFARLIPAARYRWLVGDVLMPLAACAVAAGAIRMLAPAPSTPIGAAATIAIAVAFTFGAVFALFRATPRSALPSHPAP